MTARNWATIINIFICANTSLYLGNFFRHNGAV